MAGQRGWVPAHWMQLRWACTIADATETTSCQASEYMSNFLMVISFIWSGKSPWWGFPFMLFILGYSTSPAPSGAIAANAPSILGAHVLLSLLIGNQESTQGHQKEYGAMHQNVRQRCLMGVSYMLMPSACLLDLLKSGPTELIST